MRVGDAKTRRVDVRVIAATNKDLMKETEKEAFRKDLYYRLRTVTIDVPPLRHRLDDLDLLADRFALEFSRSNDIVFRGFTSDALSVMKQYDWPGNVRELKNFVESIIIFERGNRISSDMVIKHLSPMVETVSGNLPVPVNKSTDQAERELILQQLLFLRQDMRDLKSMIGEDALDRSGEVGYLNPEGTVSNLPLAPLDPESMKSIRSSAIGEMSMNDFEREIITRTLKKFNKNRRKAAKVLGISERTLYRKINEYGLERKQKIKE